jgi:hypothetical protein
MATFIPPSFGTGELELRYGDGEVAIYGTPQGLEKLAEFCLKLARSPKANHIHLEDYQVLTTESLQGAVAVFPISN